MTQEKANQIFEGDLGRQLLSLFSTSDGRAFIRYEEAVQHTNEMINSVGGQEYVDTEIEEWFPEEGVSNETLEKEYPIQDDIWPSRRWKSDMSDYVDLSGHEDD